MFDWVVGFLAKNQLLTELSERNILEWASRVASGDRKDTCGEHPMTGLKWVLAFLSMDDTGISRLLTAIAPTLDRS